MTPYQGYAFVDHAERRDDMEPLWTGILPWAVVISIMLVIDAIFG